MEKEQKADQSTPESSSSHKSKRKSRRVKPKKKTDSSQESDSDQGMKRVLDSRQNKGKQKQNPKETLGAKEAEKPASETKSNEGGSVIVDKVNETLDALLKAWNSRVTSETPIPPKLTEYPDPLQEKIDLVRHQQLIRDTQTTFEGPQPYQPRKMSVTQPVLETIDEVSETELNESQTGNEQILPREEPIVAMIEPAMIEPEDLVPEEIFEITSTVPSLEEEMAEELWQEVRDLKRKDKLSMRQLHFQ